MTRPTKIVILGLLIIASLIAFQYYSNDINKYDLQELETLNNKIIWDNNKELKWTDFKYDENEKSFTIYAKVGISVRYNVNPPILFRSKTVFSPSESIVSDTTDLNNLRIAQAKFDLLETYRRKMEKEVDSLKQLQSPNLETTDFDKMIDRYYRNFENEWEGYRPINLESLYRIEGIINNSLK